MASVKLVNEGDAPIEGLRVACGQSRAEVARIAPGESAGLALSGRGREGLQLDFWQRRNSLSSVEILDFDPAEPHREGFLFLIGIQVNQFTRDQEEAEPARLGRLGRNLWDWLVQSPSL